MRCALLSPAGNITALFTDVEDAASFPRIAAKVIERNPTVEQVGFILPPKHPEQDFHLHMAGDEFCGNAAAASALFYLTSQDNRGRSETRFGASGIESTVSAQLAGTDVILRLEKNIVREHISETRFGNLVDLGGIIHLVRVNPIVSADDVFAKHAILALNLQNKDAVGISDLEISGDKIALRSLVWVRKIDSLISEGACCSGSIAAAKVLYRTSSSQDFDYSIQQRSGSVIRVHNASHGKRNSHFHVRIPILSFIYISSRTVIEG